MVKWTEKMRLLAASETSKWIIVAISGLIFFFFHHTLFTYHFLTTFLQRDQQWQNDAVIKSEEGFATLSSCQSGSFLSGMSDRFTFYCIMLTQNFSVVWGRSESRLGESGATEGSPELGTTGVRPLGLYVRAHFSSALRASDQWKMWFSHSRRSYHTQLQVIFTEFIFIE